MADISSYLAAILAAVYGEDVRGSIHDAIEIINDVSEVILVLGTDVTGPTSSSTGFFEDSLYLNTDTYELWKCVGTDSWASQGILKGADGSPGAPGADGNKWYRGTGISGKAVLPTVYSGSGVTLANPNDFFLNPSEGAVYYCVSGGDASTATWSYDFTMTGGGGGTSDYTDLTNKPQINSVTLSGNVSLTDIGLKTVASSGSYSDLTDKPTIPAAANSASLNIQQNGVSAYTGGGSFNANSSVAATANIITDDWLAMGSPNNGSVSFTIDDTYAGTHGYDVYINVTSSSTNKSPYAKLTTISGEGTASCTLVYETDADDGTNTAYLRRIK